MLREERYSGDSGRAGCHALPRIRERNTTESIHRQTNPRGRFSERFDSDSYKRLGNARKNRAVDREIGAFGFRRPQFFNGVARHANQEIRRRDPANGVRRDGAGRQVHAVSATGQRDIGASIY